MVFLGVLWVERFWFSGQIARWPDHSITRFLCSSVTDTSLPLLQNFGHDLPDVGQQA